ncbi:MAG TPA: DNA ligase D, partial [Clostridia bacterium]|nr:DNA ligase D [Clostridia bacterium]
MTEKLNEYNQKRDFQKTSEPQGEIRESSRPLRFVIQHHMAHREHYDLRLEWNGALLSWAIPKGPSYNTRDKRLAVRVEDHPLDYADFEGTIPAGEYGGGTVMLWDEGIWEPRMDVDSGLIDGSLKFTLQGRRLKGGWALVRIKTDPSDLKENWLLLKERDEYAKPDDGISEFTTSIRSGRSMEEIQEGKDEKTVRNPFDSAQLQHAKLVSTIPDGKDWLFELKYDGYRILAFVQGNTVRLITRNGNDYTRRFGAIAGLILDWAGGRAMVLDGEMVVTESGKTDFQALQQYLKNPGAHNLTYIIFDLLALDGEDLRGQRLTQRKDKLMDLMKDAPANLHYSRHVMGNGKECFKAACNLGMEGIVGKRADSVYSGTRNGDWVKIKCDRRQEFVIGGFALSGKKKAGISSLLLGVYSEGGLIYIGRAGTGFTEPDIRELTAKFNKITRPTSPFINPPKASADETITWVEPELVAEIKYAEMTKDNLLRQASFKGLREDKDPQDIVMEHEDEESGPEEKDVQIEMSGNSIIVGGIKITNPDKTLFDDPKITKADMVRYYAQVSERMLPYVSHRILSVVRCPKGIAQACFYKKHPHSDNDSIISIAVPNSEG